MMSSHHRNVTNPLLNPILDINLEYKLTSDPDFDLSSTVADSKYLIKS